MSRLFRVFLLLLGMAHAQAHAQRLDLDISCGGPALFSNGQVADVPWQAVEDKIAKVPVLQTCWLRVHRPTASSDGKLPEVQFLTFENSWGSNFALYSPTGALMARTTLEGERDRAVVNKSWIHVAMDNSAPALLYAKVESRHRFSTVRHSITQMDGNRVLRLQRRQLQDTATGWLLFSAAVFSLLIFLFQRNPDYALFSAFALVFALTLFSDRGDLAPLGWTASNEWLYLSYPLSGVTLAWLVLHVGRLSVFAPRVALAIKFVIALYGSLVLWQLMMMAGVPLSESWFETFGGYVYNVAALMQMLVFWGCFQGWRRGDKVSLLLAIGIAPLMLFEIQISDWFAAALPQISADLTQWLGSSLRISSYVLLPTMFFSAIAYRSRMTQRDAIRLAQRDQLTNLPNRDHFLQLGQHLIDQHPHALLLAINIDRLKAINDVLGFSVGDGVIVQVGERLASLGEGVVARVQTSQFCVLLQHADRLAEIRRRVDAAFSAPVYVMGQTLDVSLSVGIARHQGHPMSTLLRDADIALGVAKTTKVNWLAYDAAMDTTRPESLSLLSELTRAITESELRMFLQPKVRLSDGHVTGAEALIRWQHPTRGMVAPNDFIPFAEQTGKISALTIWVIREGARLAAEFRRDGTPLVVSVNISTHDLREPLFVERVLALVQEQGALPADLRLEVTESGMMEDPRMSLTVLHALCDAGFSLSIDDFGTGYSSLSYLQKMPVAELKIDRTFVRHVQRGSDGAELLDSIIALGHRMGLSVVAEGAETAEECALLQTLGCDFVQGWFVAKAMPVDAFKKWFQHNHPFVLDAVTAAVPLST